MGYDLEGRMQEVCSCQSFCPCWAGLDPDGGTCGFSWLFHFDRGHVDGVDVAGLSLGFLGDLPGNPLNGGVKLLVIVDDRATEVQQDALISAFTGQHGGPLADLAGLVAEVAAVERASLEFDVSQGSGRFRAGDWFGGEVEGYRSPTGAPTILSDATLGPVLGSPAYPGKVVNYDIHDDQHGLEFTAAGATQSEFHYVA